MADFKYELDFGLDNFQRPKMLSMKDSIAQLILNLFLMRPGNLPSLPHIGIDIRQYLYTLEDSIDVDELKNKIFNQCSELIKYVSIGDIRVFVAPYEEQAVLIVSIPISGVEEGDTTLLYGFLQDKNRELRFSFQFEDSMSI